MTNTQISNFEGSSLTHISLHICFFISAGDKTPAMTHRHDGNINISEISRIFFVSSYQEKLLMFLDSGRYGHTFELNWGFFFPPKKALITFEIWTIFTDIFFSETTVRGREISPLYPLTFFSWQLKWMKQIDRRKPNLLHIHVSMKNSKDSKARWGIYILDYGEGGKGLGLQEEVRCS